MSSRIDEDERAFYVEIGTKAKGSRKTCGMSQETVADAIDVSFQQVQKYEKGINRIPIVKIMRLAENFNVPIRELMPKSFNDLY